MEPLRLQEIVENSVRKVLAELSLQNKTKEDFHSDLLTAVDAAKYLNLAVPTIYALVATQTIPYMKQGKRLYFSKGELENWIKSGKRKTTSERKEDSTVLIVKPKKMKKR